MNVIKCPECQAEVVACDNNTYLDYPSVSYNDYPACWTIMQLGRQSWASVGDPSIDGMGHILHEHQPEDSVMA